MSKDIAPMNRFVLTLSCPDRMGIVAAVANFLVEHQCNIVDSAQFGDAANERFFMRVCFVPAAELTKETLSTAFNAVAARFSMHAAFNDLNLKSRVRIMVS